MFVVVVLSSVALVLSTLAAQSSRRQNEEQIRVEAQRVQTQLIAGCEQFNRTRLTTYNSNRALAAIVIANSQDPNRVPSVVAAFLKYNEEANDPVSCDPNDQYFMVDPTPPSIPPIPEVPL